MNDEYADMNADGETYVFPGDFLLECGTRLRAPQVRYRTYGAPNAERDNCMVVCHALTGNAALDSWWGDMLGPGKLFDTRTYFVVCCNVLGSCYGTTGPTSINPETNEQYGKNFPEITVRDSVLLHIDAVRNGLQIKRVACVVGGSLGGMQALEWALCAPPMFVRCVIAMCCGAQHTPWQIGISESQRQAIYADPKWRAGDYLRFKDPPIAGLSVARQFAMVTYRSHSAYLDKFGRDEVSDEKAGQGQARYFEVEKYLRYQGEKFPNRFDALSYIAVTRMMDTHDVGRGRGSVAEALKSLVQPVLVISVDSDLLYPPIEQKWLHDMLPTSEHHTIRSDNGHDGFLLDQAAVESIGKQFLERFCPSVRPPAHADVVHRAKERPWGKIALDTMKSVL